jgi:8-oxo-dGTP diphosphatase
MVLPVYAGAVVTDPKGWILCQLRDDKPGICFPGFWTCSPGGHVEHGENPRDAIVRELREEFEIEVAELKQLAVLQENEDGVRGIYHAFTAKLATPTDQVRCHEGQRACFFEPKAVLKLKLHPISRKIFLTSIETENGR